MKAAVLFEVNKPLVIEEVSVPNPGPREVLIRTRVREVREMSRSTQGVTLINLDKGEKLAGLERVVETDGE